MTSNPWLIMAINMSIVFAVLIAIWGIMVLIHMIDPTKKKSEPVEATPVAAAAPAAVAAPTASNDAIVAAITGAIVAMGYSSDAIASIRPTVHSTGWKLDGRLSGRM